MKFALITVVALVLGLGAFAQAPDVPIYRQGRRQSDYEGTIRSGAKALYATGDVVKLVQVKEQLKRTSCDLTLPRARTAKMSAKEICDAARRSHVRLGWYYLCNKCDDWHINLAGGYVLTADGAVATCFHVVQPEREMREGCLLAADESGKVLAVSEVLAANRYSDAAIVRVTAHGLRPLPLNTNIFPGDVAYCYSDPLDHRGYFSAGIVNRFYQFPGRRRIDAPASAAYAPTRVNVSTDWAPGSSGSAVLDEFGNALGHVATIAAIQEQDVDEETGDPQPPGPTMIVFHDAVSARDVLRLVKIVDSP